MGDGSASWGGVGGGKQIRSRDELFVNFLFGLSIRVFLCTKF